MSEKLKKLIKPMIAAVAVGIVLMIAYFSGGDVSVEDKPEIKQAESSSSVTTVSTVTTAESTTTAKLTSATTAASSTAATSASKASTKASTKKTTTTTAAKKIEAATSATTSAATAPTVTESVTETTVIVTTAAEPVSDNYCTISISCATVFDNTDKIAPDILAEQPTGGVIFAPAKQPVYNGDTVFDILKRVCSDNGIQLEYTKIAATNNFYIEGINNLYEFDAGNLSGWMYSVNGKFPQLSASQYTVSEGDVIEFVYSCSIGVDVGDDYYTKAG